ncbi:transporter [Labrys sp. WJW]|uniref:AEC family transporter n=1 Tax=Labrys sp. WJW TaxID=1737983 RepID=UPI00082F501C|nr:AEC family transporter [Labrys sp. WJW]OCC01282.1 transporter [Labrys sp. WJW]
MSPLVETVLFVFGLVALGYGAGASSYLKPETGDALSDFAVRVALPLLLFRTMVTSSFHGSAPWQLWATYFTAVAAAWIAGHLVTTRLFRRDGQAGVIGGVSAAFSNLVLLGIPFMLGVFGNEGFEILSLIISVHLPTMLMASILLFHWFGPRRQEPLHPLAIIRDFLRRLLSNPLIIGIFAGLAWRAGGVPLPGIANRFVDALADVAGPIALFAMGLGLRRFGLSGNLRPALVLSGLKLLLMPAVALGAAWLFGLPPFPAKVAVAAASLPSGVNSYLIAIQLKTEQSLASNQITIATAFSVVTTALWLEIATAVLG